MKRLSFALFVLFTAGACATTAHQGEDERLAMYRQVAGEPVPSFQFFGRLQSWTPLGDSALVVRTRPNTAYLLELAGGCPDLEFAQAIALTSQTGRVYSRFDSVRVIEPTRFDIHCRIDQIRPVELSALREAEREMRGTIETAERDQDSGGT